jgi:tight adherence protein C
MGEWAWFTVVAVGVTALCLAVLGLTIGRRAPADRLKPDPGDSHAELLLGDMTDVLSRGLPGEGRDRTEILPELDRAGMYGRNVLSEYRAVRAVLVLIPLFAAAALALLVDPPAVPYVAGGGAILAVLGFTLPRVYVGLRAAARSREIERGLPVFADMLSIALLAGQGLTGALRRVTTQLRNAFPMMTEELEILIRHTELLSLHVAFEHWARRSQSAEVRNMAMLVGQSQRLGNDVTASLLEYATHLRSESRQKADAKAQKASFWMLFPTMLCLWIPAAVVMVAPLYFDFAEKRRQAREEIQSTDPNTPANREVTAPFMRAP